MAVKKRTEQVSSVVAVDARKLGQGLKTVFDGMSMVFDSIGFDMSEVKPEPEKESDASKNTEQPSVEGKCEDIHVQETEGVMPQTQELPEATEPVTETEKTEPAPSAEEKKPKEESASSVTLDDVTQVIVQKIKQNRNNNEKIGSLLKTYGVSKVGELPSSKYEAFLTDISAI